jgi:hypothetical protein
MPPPSAVPSSQPSDVTAVAVVVLVFAKKKWPVEMEYIEKGVIIEDLNRRSK